jgi:hypothetical protein
MASKKPNTFAGAYLVKDQYELEPMSFDAEEMRACFAVKANGRCRNRPDLRLIALDGSGRSTDGKEVEPSVGVSLLCRACATRVAREIVDDIEGVRGSDVPTLGFMLLPMHIESTLVEMLRLNVTPEVWTDPKSPGPS